MNRNQSTYQRQVSQPCFLCLFLLLLVCAPLPAQTKLAAKDYQRLASYINIDDGSKLLTDPLVHPQLVRRMGAQLSHLKTNLNVAGPIGVSSGILTWSGNAPHRGLEENGFLGVDLYSGDAYAVLLTSGKFEVYGKEQNYDYMPYAVREWVLTMWAMIHLKGSQPPNVVMHPKP